MSSTAKKQKFAQYKGPKKFFKKQFLEAGQRGFLATCNFREKDCVRECLNILTQTSDELYGPQDLVPANNEGDADPASPPADIADELQKQIDAEKQKGKDVPKKRFQTVETGTTNCVFIKTTLPDPVEVAVHIVKEIARTGEAKSRYLLRLVPVEAVCHANLPSIAAAGGAIFDKHFLKEPSTFAIVFNKRYNNDLKRDDVIRDLAALVQAKNAGNRVDLKQSAKTVVVEVIKGLCCLSVVEGYLQHKKYNLVELAANAKQPPPVGETSEEKKTVEDALAETDAKVAAVAIEEEPKKDEQPNEENEKEQLKVQEELEEGKAEDEN